MLEYILKISHQKTKLLLKAIIAAFVLATAVVGLLLWTSTREPSFGGDLDLTYRGNQWKFSDDPQELNLIYFGYAKCPDVCPLTLSFAGGAFKMLSSEEQAKVRLLFLSVDQEHDIPNDVADYATNFFPHFLGLSGSKNQIDATIKMFPASYMVENTPKTYLGYSIIHTDRIFFLNKRGKVIDSIGSPRESGSIFKKIKEHL
jgi:protein SCO1